MKNIKNSKLLLKILSGIIALVLWFAITYTEDPVISQTLTGIRLELVSEDTLNANGFAVINRDELPAISVVIRGSRSNVISALGEIYASADVSAIKNSGENQLPVSYTYPTGRVVLEKIKTREIPIETEVLISREIPVKTEIFNREKNSDYILKSEAATDNVTVSGAAHSIYKLSYARVRIDASKISKTSTQDCIFELCTEKGDTVSEEDIVSKSVSAVSVKNTVYKKTSLPVKVILDGENNDGYGFVLKNAEKNTVDAGLDDGVSVDFIEATVTPQKEKNSFEAELLLPEGVYVPEENRTLTVTGEILPKTLKEVTVDIELINAPEGKVFTVSPPEKTVTLKTVKDAEDIKLTATVDVSGMTASEEMLPIELKTEDDADIIGSYSVTVKAESEE